MGDRRMLNQPRRLLLWLGAGAAALAVLAGSAASGDHQGRLERERARYAPAVGAVVTRHWPTRVAGQSWSVEMFRNAAGEVCLAERVAVEAGSVHCRREPLFDDQPVLPIVGARQDPGQAREWAQVWLAGLVAPTVARLEVHHASCSKERIPVDRDGVYFRVVPGASLESSWPVRLVAFGVDGRVVWAEEIPLRSPGGEARAPAVSCRSG
jgi:hypothetical protein